MAFIPIPNCAKVTLQWVVGGQVVEITLSFSRAGGYTAPTLALLAQDVKDWYDTEMKPTVNQYATLQNINATDQTSATAPSWDLPITTGGAGTRTGNPEPNNATAAVKFLTANRGRSYRGRIYWPTLTTSQVLNSVSIVAATAVAMVVAFSNLGTYLTISGTEHVVASRFTGGAPRVTGIYTPVTAYAMDQSIDSQRRRLEGRGI